MKALLKIFIGLFIMGLVWFVGYWLIQLANNYPTWFFGTLIATIIIYLAYHLGKSIIDD